jgi:3-deoxy-D-manno-octulosonic acid kinase
MTKPSSSLPKGHAIWFNSELVEQVSDDWFDPEYWRKLGQLKGSAVGRGTTYFFSFEHNDWVLRHYKRGGLVGKALNDQYLYTGLNQTRAWQELRLLQKLNDLALPAPTPLAARVIKHFGYYTADLISAKIAEAQDIHQILLERLLSSQIWDSIGATIAMFHQHQVYHHDLNIHNIMLDHKDKVWLIDFDKCAIKAGEGWKQDNLDRLLRSLKKESTKANNYHFSNQNWLSLISGYQTASVGNPPKNQKLS